ncbi:hypothetical protein V6N13_083457 [Hibiscus sabdariffa]
MYADDASNGIRQKDVSLGSNLVSLFVEHLPKNTHWKGLWQMFARVGEVFDAFIANKLSRGEKHFGFVKVGYRQDALRIIERLNGFITYGYRLQDWGLGEIKVQSLGGKSFLLFVEDDKLYSMLEDLKWSYLKEIFSRVINWSDSMIQPTRATWLEISGVPLHSWNGTTLKRITELFGSFEAFGENYKHSLDCDKSNRIHELVDLEVGNRSYEVFVKEIGFRDDTIDPLIPKNGLYKQNNEKKLKANSRSESSSKSGTNLPPVENRCNSFNEEDVVNEMCVGKGNSCNND